MAKKKARSGPREGHGYPVKPTWQEDVKAEIAKRRITEKAFAKLVGCAQSTMHDLLNKRGRDSTLVPLVHAALGWDPPPDPQAPVILPSPEALEVAAMFDRLPEQWRKKIRDEAQFALSIVVEPSKPTN